MSKVFHSLFKKRDNKDRKKYYSKTDNSEGMRYVRDVSISSVRNKEYSHTKSKPTQLRTSESLSKDPAYLNRLFGLKKEGTIRLFNPSEKKSSENLYNSPRHKHSHQSVERKDVNEMFTQNMPLVYAANVIRESSNINSRSILEPSEPFPYKVYNSLPRRSTLHYGVDYEGKSITSDNNLQNSVRKTLDSISPSTSFNDGNRIIDKTFSDNNEERFFKERRVTILTPSEKGDNFYENEKNDPQSQPVTKTIIRFRPQSSASIIPRESVKLMVFRADMTEPPPLTLGKHVHQVPLKKVKKTPVLMADDGRILKPIERDKQSRTSSNFDREVSQVRVSMADLENVCKVPRKSADILNSVHNPRQSINRSSIRQSGLSHRQIETRRQSSIVREDSVLPEQRYFPYNMKENKPMVYAVPITTSRRTGSLLRKHSITSSDLKTNPMQCKINENTHSSINYSKINSNDDQRFSIRSQPPGRISIDKKEPLVVFEVHNLPKETLSNTRDSKPSKKSRMRCQRNSSQVHHALPNQTMSPQMKVIYQDPKTHPGLLQKIKSKLSCKKLNTGEHSTNSQSEAELNNQKHQINNLPEIPSKKRTLSKKQQIPFFYTKNEKENLPNKDECGLTCEEPQENECFKTCTIPQVKMVSSAQQTDLIEDDLDFLCYPLETASKTSTDDHETDSKLKWRIIIKKEKS